MIEFRGAGPLAFVPLVFAGIAFGGMVEADATLPAAAVVTGLTLAAAGTGLLLTARLLHQPEEPDSFYFIPLWVWGVIYFVLGLALAGRMAFELK